MMPAQEENFTETTIKPIKKAFGFIPGKEIVFGFLLGLIAAIAVIVLFLNFSFFPAVSSAIKTVIRETREKILTKYDTNGDGVIDELDNPVSITEESSESTEIVEQTNTTQETTNTANSTNSTTTTTPVTNQTTQYTINQGSATTNIYGDVHLGDITGDSLNIYNSYLNNEGDLYIGGTSEFDDDVTMNENLTVEGDLRVNGDSRLRGDYAQIGAPNPGTDARFVVYLPTEFNEDVTFNGEISFSDGATLGDTTIEGDITVEGDVITTTHVNSPAYCDENGENCVSQEDIRNNTTTEILKTAASYDGNFSYTGGLVGYQAANARCAAEYTSSHFCTTNDVMRVIAHEDITGFTGTGWIAEGPPGFTAESNDCNGYKTASAIKLGAYWLYEAAGGGAGWLVNCSTQRPISCCR